LTTLPFIVLGAGGHAKVVVAALQSAGDTVLSCTDVDPAKHGSTLLGVPVIGPDRSVFETPPDQVFLAMGIGMGKSKDLLVYLTRRLTIARAMADRGYRFKAIVHPSAFVSAECQLNDGAQVMAGAIIQPGCRIGSMAIINTRASIDHDCMIGEGAHIAPGATLGGEVRVGAGTLVAIGAVVLPGIVIGAGSIVGAGAIVLRDVAPGKLVAGLPASERKTPCGGMRS
jgi:UDP-perosamine 4-acetyltransferase